MYVLHYFYFSSLDPQQRRLDIKISLPAKSEMDVIDDSEYPKLFRLRLFAATNGAR